MQSNFLKVALTLLFLSVPLQVQAEGGARGQSTLLYGIDTPATGSTISSTYSQIRFELAKGPSTFTPRLGFSYDFGSSVSGGEVNLGLVLYPFFKMRDELRFQPFIGADINTFIGKRKDVVTLAAGGSFVAGVDVRMFGHTAGTLEADYTYFPNQRSARILFGITYSAE